MSSQRCSVAYANRVFGSTGPTGHPLVEQALERGHEVGAFVRDTTGLSSTVRTGDRVSIVEGDPYTGEGVDRAIAGDGDPVDAVVSVLGQTSAGPDDLLRAAGRHIRSNRESGSPQRDTDFRDCKYNTLPMMC